MDSVEISFPDRRTTGCATINNMILLSSLSMHHILLLRGDAALGKHFSIMHHRYSQSSMLLKHTANSPILDQCCMLQQHATRHFKVSHLRAQVEGWYCYNDWLYHEKLFRFCLKNGFIITKSFPYDIPICKILYKLKLYYSQLMESFNIKNFLVWICFNFGLANKKYLWNCQNPKIWNHFIINQLLNPLRTISEWELSVTRCSLCYSLRFNCSSPS